MAPCDVTIRRAGKNDAALIASMNIAMALETEGIALEPERALRGVVRCLEQQERGFYLLAERDGLYQGQLMITYEWSDWRDGVIYWIQSVYVAADARRTGVYRALYEHVLADIDADPDAVGVRLYVHPDNVRARATYEQLGMKCAEYLIYEVDQVIDR